MSFHRFCLTVSVLLFTASATMAAEKAGPTIQKCRDASGKWHYGDTAAAECNKSKVEIINKEGFKTKEIAAPPTEAELAERERRKDQIEREKRSAEEQTKRDKILIQTYAVEDDIILIRDRKLSQIEASIKASEETLKSLRNALARMEKQSEDEKNDQKAAAQTQQGITQTKAQIVRHEKVVAKKREEQEQLRKQYAEELERYRQLKGGTASKIPVKTTP